jgi:hypothetical protein
MLSLLLWVNHIIFRQISDSHGFASVVKSIRKQTHVRIGGQVQTGVIRDEQTGRNSQVDNKMQVTQTKTVTPNINIVNTIICNKCSNSSNPKGSKFCNKCGSKLQNNCPNCGNTNPESSVLSNDNSITSCVIISKSIWCIHTQYAKDQWTINILYKKILTATFTE